MTDQQSGKFQAGKINPFAQIDGDCGVENIFEAFGKSEHSHQTYANSTNVYATPISPTIIPPEEFFTMEKHEKAYNGADTEVLISNYQKIYEYISPPDNSEMALQEYSLLENEVLSPEVNIQNENSVIQSSQENSNQSSTLPNVHSKKQPKKQAKKRNNRKTPQVPGSLDQKTVTDSTLERSESPSALQTNPNGKKKKDERKNMYGYSFKFIVKAYLSIEYSAIFNKLCAKYGVIDKGLAREFYSQKLTWSISLKDLRSLLNFDGHPLGSQERKIIQSFHHFYVWFMRKRYTLHILTEDKIVHKEPYLYAKNFLIYLPKILEKDSKKSTRLSDRQTLI